MKTVITYATECALTVYFNEDSAFCTADWREHFYSLANAIEHAELIMTGEHEITRIVVWDAKTGEILAECYPEEDEDDDDEYPDYPDWGYDEDEGYDPYEGCYTWDC